MTGIVDNNVYFFLWRDMALRSEKQKMFVQEYLVDLNATQAAIRAGYSKNRADATGYNLLRNPEIQAELQKAKEKRCKKTAVTQEMIVNGLLKEALDEENGSPASRVSAWEKLGKHVGIFGEDNAQKIPREFVISRRNRDK